MKKIFRKNQLVITALALMIAVAGYFSYMNSSMGDKEVAAEAAADSTKLDYEISDEDTLLEGEIFTDEGTGEEVTDVALMEENSADPANAAAQDANTDAVADAGAQADMGTDAVADAGQDGEVLTDSGTDAVAAGADAADPNAADGAVDMNMENPGEAVLTSTAVANLDYAAEMKLNREQIRSKNKEALLEIINNTAIADELKQDAVDKMVALTDIAEREAAAEMLLEAKGFTDVVISIIDDNCDVVLNMGEVTDAKRAQVEDIVKRKTNIPAEQIVITPIVVEEVN